MGSVKEFFKAKDKMFDVFGLSKYITDIRDFRDFYWYSDFDSYVRFAETVEDFGTGDFYEIGLWGRTKNIHEVDSITIIHCKDDTAWHDGFLAVLSKVKEIV